MIEDCIKLPNYKNLPIQIKEMNCVVHSTMATAQRIIGNFLNHTEGLHFTAYWLIDWLINWLIDWRYTLFNLYTIWKWKFIIMSICRLCRSLALIACRRYMYCVFTCCDTGLRLLWSHLKYHPTKSSCLTSNSVSCGIPK